MSHKELSEALDVVHRELSQSEHLDEQEVEQLRVTIGEIEAALGRQHESGESLSDRVAGSARRFEQSHPKLTETLGRIADILQQMGI